MSIPVSIDPLGTLGGVTLPPGYEAVESARFGVGCYTDLPYYDDGTTVLRARLEIDPWTDLNGIGSGINAISSDYFLRRPRGEYYCGRLTASRPSVDFYYGDAVLDIAFELDGIYVNGELKMLAPAGDTRLKWGLGAPSMQHVWSGGQRLYGASVWKDGVELARYVPCRNKSDETYHIYDVLGKEFLVTSKALEP